MPLTYIDATVRREPEAQENPPVALIQATAGEVRVWAAKNGMKVGSRGHLPVEVIGAFNRRHRTKAFVNRNPWLGGNA